MRWRWFRWEATIVGRYSENVTPLPFVRFRHMEEGWDWVRRMNRAHNGDDPDPLIYYALRKIR